MHIFLHLASCLTIVCNHLIFSLAAGEVPLILESFCHILLLIKCKAYERKLYLPLHGIELKEVRPIHNEHHDSIVYFISSRSKSIIAIVPLIFQHVNYICNTWKFGLLYLPSGKVAESILRGLVQDLLEKYSVLLKIQFKQSKMNLAIQQWSFH